MLEASSRTFFLYDFIALDPESVLDDVITPFSSYVSSDRESLVLTDLIVKVYCLENCPLECLSEYLNSTFSSAPRLDRIESALERSNSKLAISFKIPNGSTFSKSLNKLTGFDENKEDVLMSLVV